MIEILELQESFAGMHIVSACEKASELAARTKQPVHFVFNDTHVTAQPGESPEVIMERWDADREAAHQAWMASPERAEREAKRAEDDRKAREAHMVESAQTEEQMREAKVPYPLTKEQLMEYIDSVVDRNHGYGTCAYALSMAAVATFKYVSGKLGVTGFQASYADLDILRRTRGMEGPFMLIKSEDALYPQYDLPERLAKAMEEWKPWLKEQAQEKLAEGGVAHPNVVAHWKKLAK